MSERRLDDVSISAMSESQLREELISLRSRFRAMHRRAQHSVPARERAEMRAQRDQAVRRAELRGDSWLREFLRGCENRRAFKEIYEIAAKKLGLPYGRYHSVSDIPFGRASDGQLYANVYLSPQGGIETFNLRDVIARAIEERPDQ